MDDDPVAVLTAALQDPDLAPRHEEIRRALAKQLPLGVAAPDASRDRQPPSEPTFGDRMSQGWSRLRNAAAPVARGINDAADRTLNAATMGGWRAAENAATNLSGHQVGPSKEEAADFQQEHPWVSGTADALGYVAPAGAPARVGEAIGRGVDALTGAVAKRGLAARLAARGLGGAATGAATGAVVQGGEAASRGESPSQIGREALSGAETGAEFGGPLGFAGGAAGEAARAAREASPDLSILHKYGLEPGPVPGRPVIRQSQSVLSQLPGMSEPPLGVSRANPATRGAAARGAGDEILPDLAARARANSGRFGELQGQAFAAIRARKAQFPADPIVSSIDADMGDPRHPQSTRAALGALKARILENATVQLGNSSIHVPAKSLPEGLPVRNLSVPAEDMDAIRDFGDTLARQEKAARSSDIPLLRATAMIRGEPGAPGKPPTGMWLHAPELADLNAQYGRVKSGFDARRELLGVPKSGDRSTRAPVAGEEPDLMGDVSDSELGEFNSPRDPQGFVPSEQFGRAVAQRIRQAGEETATAGVGTTRGGTANERLARMGAPPTLPGTRGLPPEPTYGARLDVPRLQLAQENLQLTPSKLFSGATSGPGFAHRLAVDLPVRAGYPLLRRAGDATVAAKPVAADALIAVLRGRRDKATRNWQSDEDRSQ